MQRTYDVSRSGLPSAGSRASLGASTATQQWGPAVQFPLMMGGNAPGFSHVFLGSANPFSTWIGLLHARAIWGRLEESDYTERSGAAKSRFGTGVVLSFSPRGTTGLELGVSRFFHTPWREGGPNTDDLLRIFEPSRSQETALEARGIRQPENQLISVFGRWTFQANGLEVYFEYARDDFADNFADLMGEPEHDAGYVLGSQKAWEPEVGRVMQFTAEVLNARKGQIRELRVQRNLYRHGGVSQGQDVMYSLGGEALWFKGRWEWTAGLTVTWNLNRNFESDRWNLRPTVRSRVSL